MGDENQDLKKRDWEEYQVIGNFIHPCSKAVAAKERKNEKAAAEKNAKQKKAEDAHWADDDKNLGKFKLLKLYGKLKLYSQ